MNAKQRRLYFTQLWPAACEANGWDPKDDECRREVTEYATHQPSTRMLSQAQITALFLYLRHLAHPEDPRLAEQWRACRQDRSKFNLVRQAEHFRRLCGYSRIGKLSKDRFAIFFEEELDLAAIDDAQLEQFIITCKERLRRKRELEKHGQQVADEMLALRTGAKRARKYHLDPQRNYSQTRRQLERQHRDQLAAIHASGRASEPF